MKEMLFDPLKMTSAAFYLDDDDPRVAKIPQLYGGVLRNPTNMEEGCEVKPYSECLSPSSVPNTTPTEHY